MSFADEAVDDAFELCHVVALFVKYRPKRKFK